MKNEKLDNNDKKIKVRENKRELPRLRIVNKRGN